MSVTVTARTLWRPAVNLRADPSLPERIWYAQGAIVGDAGGGFMEVVIVLNAAGATRSGRSWSIETSIPRLSVVNDGDIAIINSLNMDVIGPGLNNPIQKGFAHVLRGSSTAVEAPETTVLAESLHPKLFLGAQGASDSDAEVRCQVANATSQILGWYAEGYEWGPGALNVGYRRPLDGLFAD